MLNKKGRGEMSAQEASGSFLRKKQSEAGTFQLCPHAHVILMSEYSMKRAVKWDIFLRKHLIYLKVIKI